MWSSEEEPGLHIEDGLDEFLLTMDPADIRHHPLDGDGPEDKPALHPLNVVVLKAFWQMNGFRDGSGGAIMPGTIEWWIDKERGELTAQQIRDVRDLVPIADQHWRMVQMQRLERERERDRQKG